MNAARLRASFRRASTRGTQIAALFYADLFSPDRRPDLRPMFPDSTERQEQHLGEALEKITAAVAQAEDLTAYLKYLGVAHRKFGVRLDAGHYEAVGASLLAVLADVEGPNWTDELAADWEEAYGIIAGAMQGAAAEDEKAGNPPWWDGTVTAVRRLDYDVTALTVRVTPEIRWIPGQSVDVETMYQPNEWRKYSPANAPRGDSQLDLHVRLVDGGTVSMPLTNTVRPGDHLRIGPPAGTLHLTAAAGPLLLIGQSTGIAPLKAILEHAARMEAKRPARVFFAARTDSGLYLLDELREMARQHPWLQVIPVIASAPGVLAEAICASSLWPDSEAYLAGPSDMIREARAALDDAGLPAAQVHKEDYGWKDPEGGSE